MSIFSSLLQEQCKKVYTGNLSVFTDMNNIPFAVYSFTAPGTTLPEGAYPHEFKDTIYIGISGKGYDDWFYDRKDKVKDRCWKQSKVHKRCKCHKKHIVNIDEDSDDETSYKEFFRIYGGGKEIADKVGMTIWMPRTEMPAVCVRPWLLAIESSMVMAYSERWSKTPIMQIAHSLENGMKYKANNSHSMRKAKEVEQTNNLMMYL